MAQSTKIEKNEMFEDLRREEIAQLEAENHRLRDEFQKTLKTSARLEEVGKLREENKQLKQELEGVKEGLAQKFYKHFDEMDYNKMTILKTVGPYLDKMLDHLMEEDKRLTAALKELKEELELSEDKVCELTHENKKLSEENSQMKKNGGFVGDPETAECANAIAWRMTQEKIKKLEDFTNWENHPALKHKVVLDEDWYQQHLDEEGQLIDPEQLKKLQETVAEQANDLFFIRCESQAGGDEVMGRIGYGAEWAEEVKEAMRRNFHNCPVNDVDEKEMFKRYLEWANIYLSDVESDDDDE